MPKIAQFVYNFLFTPSTDRWPTVHLCVSPLTAGIGFIGFVDSNSGCDAFLTEENKKGNKPNAEDISVCWRMSRLEQLLRNPCTLGLIHHGNAEMLVDLSQLCFRKKECGLLVKPLMCGHKLSIEWPCDEMHFHFWLFSVGFIFQCWRFSLHFTSCLSSEFNFLTLTQATKNPQSHVSVSSQVSREKTSITNNPQKWEATFFSFIFVCMFFSFFWSSL